MVKQNQDTNERERLEEARYRGLYDSSIDGIASATMDGHIIECNQAFSNMFGYSKDEITQMNYLDFIPGKWRDIVARIISEQILPRGFSDVLEIEGSKKEGLIFPASARIWVIKDEDGKPSRMWVLVRDITERKKLEGKLKAYTEKLKRLDEERAEELRRKTVELEVLNKELEAFSYSVSHDLRAPLRSIDGFSKALLDDYIEVLDAEGRDYLQRVRKATKRMAEIIDELLALSRVTRTEMHREKVDLSKMVQEVLTELQESQPERQVDLIVAPELVADGDPRLLNLVFDNLLGNAWKFTGNKSNAKIEFGVTWKGIDRVFFVRDNGAGFNMEYANKLFGAFQRLHSPEEFPGVGVGLATVKRIINRHGGRVWAEAEVGKGATFYFTL
jgi:PAS domain S-box-containing protein